MRRGSISTFVNDGRRHSAGMVAPEVHRNSRQEFTMQDVVDDTMGGCFVSYRKIAFAVVAFIAFLVAGAFVGVYINLPVDREMPDSLTILAKEEEPVPEKYVLAGSVRALEYRVALELEAHSARGRTRVKGRVSLEFEQSRVEGPSQVVLDCKNLTMKAHRIYDLNAPENATQTGEEREKRDTVADSSDGTAMPSLRMVNESSFKTELKTNGNKTDVAGSDYVIFLEKPLRLGNYLLEIEYETEVDDRVMFVKDFSKNNESRLLLVSKLKPSNAPRLFPTLDEAKLKASFVLTLLHPRDTKVLSNTPPMNTSYSLEEMMMADSFAATRSMLPHNLAFVVAASDLLGEVTTSAAEAGGVRCYGEVGREPREFYLLDKIEPTLEACATALGRVDRPVEKIDLAALPVDFVGLSAPGLIVMRDLLFYTEVGAPSYEKAEALRELVGLVAHQWLGGLVNAKNWTDAWYIEGSALYLQYALLDKIDPSLDGSKDFLVDVLMDAMESDGYQISKAIESPVNRTRIEAFDLSDTYKKGACLISMLHDILGEGAPGTGYADFLRRWGYSRADSAAFFRAMAGNVSLDERTNLSEALAGWTSLPGYPVVNITWNPDNATVSVRQMKFNFDEWTRDEDEDEEEEGGAVQATHGRPFWWVPLTYVTAAGDWTKPTTAWLKGKEEMILENLTAIGDESWIVFNVNRKGYYRVNYDEENWRALTEALLRNHEDIPEATRASLLDDALSLARQGSLAYEVAFNLLRYIAHNEGSYGPWRVFAWHARQLDFVLYENQAYPSFQEAMRKWTSKLFDDMESQIDEGLPLAILAMQLACTFEYQKCTDWAKDKWNSVYNKSEAEITLPRHVRETVYCIGAQRGGQEELAYLTRRVEAATSRPEKDQLLSALSCFQRPWILQKLLNDILESHKYEENDVKVILQSYAKNPAASKVARRFVQENWERIVHRFSNSYWTMKAFVEASMSLLFTERDLREFNTFRDKNIDSLKAMGHWVALSEMKAISWVARLKRSSSSIRRWLESHNDFFD